MPAATSSAAGSRLCPASTPRASAATSQRGSQMRPASSTMPQPSTQITYSSTRL
ncbi:MAG: hypothetical protein ACRYFK_14165 [Janthinobacterium lividum]